MPLRDHFHDVVTTRRASLYAELLEWLGLVDSTAVPEPFSAHAATCRWQSEGARSEFQAWPHVLEIGKPLPVIPLWLSEDRAVPLDLETSYEQTCRVLRIS